MSAKLNKAPKRAPRTTPLRSGPLIVAILALATIFSLPALRGSGREMDFAGNLAGFLVRFFPPDFSIWPEISQALAETAQIAFVATLISVAVSLPVSLAAAQNLSPRWLCRSTRFGLNLIRSIPSLIWALLAVVVVGANSLAGVIALVFYSAGYLGKFFSDAIESVDLSVADALRAAGADRVQAFQYGVWPQARPLVWSHALWMLEYNVRSAAIIGYVGAGGIGVWLHTYQEFGQWDRFSAVLLCILAVVLVLDWLGSRLRRDHQVASGGD